MILRLGQLNRICGHRLEDTRIAHSQCSHLGLKYDQNSQERLLLINIIRSPNLKIQVSILFMVRAFEVSSKVGTLKPAESGLRQILGKLSWFRYYA
jgi:hypothetical protein